MSRSGARKRDVLVAGQELERECSVEESAVRHDGCGPVEVFKTADLVEAGALEAELQPPVISHRLQCVRAAEQESKANGHAADQEGADERRYGRAPVDPAKSLIYSLDVAARAACMDADRSLHSSLSSGVRRPLRRPIATREIPDARRFKDARPVVDRKRGGDGAGRRIDRAGTRDAGLGRRGATQPLGDAVTDTLENRPPRLPAAPGRRYGSSGRWTQVYRTGRRSDLLRRRSGRNGDVRRGRIPHDPPLSGSVRRRERHQLGRPLHPISEPRSEKFAVQSPLAHSFVAKTREDSNFSLLGPSWTDSNWPHR